MINEKIKGFIESPVSNDFGLTIDTIAEKCKTYGRFNAWLNQDINQIKQVLNNVKNAGLSPAFFASYELTEGYNSSWGWLNHTVQKGDYFQDATSVSNVVINQSNNMSGNPSWIDYGNPVDFVPSSVKSEGNTHFSTLAKGTIGRALIPLTAAATWEVYYPNGLLKEYNLIQNYAKPINLMVDTIIAWGGSIDGTITDPDPDPDPDIPDGEGDGGGTGIDLVTFINDLNELIKNMLSSDIYHMGSSDYYKNDYVRLMEQMKNSYKIQPNKNFFKAIEEQFKDFNDGYIPEPEDPTDPEDPDPNPATKVFPVRLGNGINFWKRNNWGYGTLQRNMTYGSRSDGTEHYAYDIGGGGNVHHTIYSVTNGTVLEAFYENFTGYHIVIKNDDDQYFIQYAHLDSFLVNVGGSVQAGDPIARMGNTGWDNMAIHLDIGIAKDKDNFYSYDNTIDPEIYLEVDKDNSTKLPLP